MNEEKVVVSDEPRRLGEQYLKDLYSVCDSILSNIQGVGLKPSLLDHMYVTVERDINDDEILICVTKHLVTKIMTDGYDTICRTGSDFVEHEPNSDDALIYTFKDCIKNYGKVVLLSLPSSTDENLGEGFDVVFNWFVVSENNDPHMYNQIQDILLSEATPSIKS